MWCNLIIFVNRCETVYFMTRRKLLHRMKEVCGATSHMMDKLIVVEQQVDGTWLLIYIYILIFLPYLSHIKMITNILSFFYCIPNLLSFIVTMCWTEFLYELYSNSHVLVYYN